MSVREYLLNGPLGFGGAPLGSMFRNIPDAEAEGTVDAAWQQGTRYFDTAPFYSMARACRKYNWARPWPNTSATNTGSVPPELCALARARLSAGG